MIIYKTKICQYKYNCFFFFFFETKLFYKILTFVIDEGKMVFVISIIFIVNYAYFVLQFMNKNGRKCNV